MRHRARGPNGPGGLGGRPTPHGGRDKRYGGRPTPHGGRDKRNAGRPRPHGGRDARHGVCHARRPGPRPVFAGNGPWNVLLHDFRVMAGSAHRLNRRNATADADRIPQVVQGPPTAPCPALVPARTRTTGDRPRGYRVPTQTRPPASGPGSSPAMPARPHPRSCPSSGSRRTGMIGACQVTGPSL